MRRTDRHLRRRALTLIELLVVIVILTTLVAAAIPLLAPATNDRRVREATRGLNAYISAAQSNAIRTGRPFGIALKPLSQDTGDSADNALCIEVYQVEQPPPFAGFSVSSMARVALDVTSGGALIPGQVRLQFLTRANQDPPANDGLPSGWDREGIPPQMYRPGDVVELGGTRYVLTDTSEDLDAGGYYKPIRQSGGGAVRDTLVARPANDSGQMLNVIYDNEGDRIKGVQAISDNFPPPFWTEPSPYKVLRQPTLTSTAPYQLPEGSAIDLQASGVPPTIQGNPGGAVTVGGVSHVPRTLGSINNPIDNNDYIVLMFSPDGSVSRLRFSQEPGFDNSVLEIFDEPITSNFFLLVGSRENVPVDPTVNFAGRSSDTEEAINSDKRKVNWLSPDSRWVVIGAQTGTIVTVENAFVDPVTIADSNPNLLSRRVEEINRAREFAREMTRTGGR